MRYARKNGLAVVLACAFCWAGAEGTSNAQSIGPQFTPPQFNPNSTVSFTETADVTTNNPAPFTMGPIPLPSVAPSSYQLGNPFSIKEHTSTAVSKSQADAGVYAITSANNLGIGLTTGTGILQDNSADLFNGSSELSIAVNANWTLPSGYPSVGLPQLAYQFALGGTVGPNGSVEFQVNLNVTDGRTRLPGIQVDNVYYSGQEPDTDATAIKESQSFATLVSGLDILSLTGPLSAGSNLTISGTINFLALNDPDPIPSSLEEVDMDSLPLPAPLAMGATGLLMVGGVMGWRRLRPVSA